MDDTLRRLLDLAWKTVPARDANFAISRARRAAWAGEESARRGATEAELAAGEAAAAAEEADGSAADAPMARSYELLLGPDATFAAFAAEDLPRLIYHLESIGSHLPRALGVVLCFFEGERLHFLQAGELIAFAAERLGTTPEVLAERHGTGESRTAVRGTPLALPGPESND